MFYLEIPILKLAEGAQKIVKLFPNFGTDYADKSIIEPVAVISIVPWIVHQNDFAGLLALWQGGY